MGFNLTRRTVLFVYAVLIIVPMVVVLAGSFKTSSTARTTSRCSGRAASAARSATVRS
jgi:ABC-type glycerol-3-phosphate transport system permease component